MKTDKELAPILRVCQTNLSKKAYEKLVDALHPEPSLVADHNRIMYDAHAALGMLSAEMSAVKGAPTATKVALWRSRITEAQATLKSLASAGR